MVVTKVIPALLEVEVSALNLCSIHYLFTYLSICTPTREANSLVLVAFK